MSNCKANNNTKYRHFLILCLLLSGCANRDLVRDNNELPDPAIQSTSTAAPQLKQYFDPKIHYIFFDKNQARFKDSYANELLIVFDELKKLKNSCIEVYGYDSLDKDYNSTKKLADTRAEWTRRCLLGEGVDSQYIKIVEGKEPVRLPKKPSVEDIRQARRVEVHVVPCDDAEFKLKTKSPTIDRDNPFKYK